MTRVKVKGDFLGWLFGHKTSTYTRVNAVKLRFGGHQSKKSR